MEELLEQQNADTRDKLITTNFLLVLTPLQVMIIGDN